MIDPTLPCCSPYLRRPVRDLLTALQDVATARKIGMIEAARLVEPPKVVNIKDYRK